MKEQAERRASIIYLRKPLSVLCRAGVEYCCVVSETFHRIRLTHSGLKQKSVLGWATGEGERVTCTQIFPETTSSRCSSVDASSLCQD